MAEFKNWFRNAFSFQAFKNAFAFPISVSCSHRSALHVGSDQFSLQRLWLVQDAEAGTKTPDHLQLNPEVFLWFDFRQWDKKMKCVFLHSVWKHCNSSLGIPDLKMRVRARRPANLTQLHQFCQEEWTKTPVKLMWETCWRKPKTFESHAV